MNVTIRMIDADLMNVIRSDVTYSLNDVARMPVVVLMIATLMNIATLRHVRAVVFTKSDASSKTIIPSVDIGILKSMAINACAVRVTGSQIRLGVRVRVDGDLDGVILVNYDWCGGGGGGGFVQTSHETRKLTHASQGE